MFSVEVCIRHWNWDGCRWVTESSRGNIMNKSGVVVPDALAFGLMSEGALNKASRGLLVGEEATFIRKDKGFEIILTLTGDSFVVVDGHFAAKSEEVHSEMLRRSSLKWGLKNLCRARRITVTKASL